MHMLAVAGQLLEGFRHEARQEAVLAGDALDRPLQQHRLVAGVQRVGHMVQVDLELAGRILAYCGFGIQGLGGAHRFHIAHETVEIMQLLQTVDLGGVRAPAGVQDGGRARPAAAVRARIQQVEFKLDRDGGGQAHLAQGRVGARQDVPGVGEIGRAVRLEQRTQCLRHRPVSPGDVAQPPGHGAAILVGVAVRAAVGNRGDVLTRRVQDAGRARQPDAVGQQRPNRPDHDPFAAQHAAHIRLQRFDDRDVGMPAKELFGGLFGRNRLHSAHSDGIGIYRQARAD